MNIKSWFLRHRFVGATFALASLYFLFAPLFGRLHYDFRPETFLVFHSLMEATSVIIAFMCFGITFHSFHFSRDGRNLLLGMTFLAVGMIDVMHALSYAGMPAFVTPNTVDKATQLWIAGRIIAAGGFVLAAFGHVHLKDLTNRYAFVAASLLTVMAVFVGTVLYPGEFPAMFVPGKGLTPLKVFTEYTVAACMLAAGWKVFFEYRRTREEHLPFFTAAMVILVFSELFFTLYADPYDIYNFMGHVYKTLGYFLIYRMLFVSSIKYPYAELINAKEVLANYATDLEGVVKARTEELEARNVELEHLVRLKTDFLAMCSHDMKTPIQSTLLHLELLLDEIDGPLTHDQAQDMETIQKNQKELMELITNLLDLARQENAALVLVPEETNVGSMVGECVSIHRPVAGRMSIEFSYEEDARLTEAVRQLDAPKFKQAINNLLSNALKFTPRGGRIELSAGLDDDGGLLIRIYNTGGNIPEDELCRIFDRFVQASEAGRARGTGLGLSIAKTMVELHGGRIWAENKGDDGVEFSIYLPPHIQDTRESSGPSNDTAPRAVTPTGIKPNTSLSGNA